MPFGCWQVAIASEISGTIVVFDVAGLVVCLVLAEELKVCVDIGCGLVCCICNPVADEMGRTIPRPEFILDGVIRTGTVGFGVDEASVHANDG